MTDLDPDDVGRPGRGAPSGLPMPAQGGFDLSRRVTLTPPGSAKGAPGAGRTAARGARGSFLDRPGVPPVTKAAAWRWFFYALVGFLGGQIAGGVSGVVAGSIAGKSAAQMSVITSSTVPPEWYVVSTLVGLWIGFFGAPWWASRRQGTGHFLADLGVRFRWADLWGLAIGVGAQIVISLLYAPFQHDIHDFNGPTQKLTGGAHGTGLAVIVLATVVAVPFMEELFFRGLLFKALARLCTPAGSGAGATRARRAGVVVAVLADGLLFGLAHGEWVQFAGLALFGVVLAAVSYRTGRLGMNMVSHATFNLIALVAYFHWGGVIR